MRPKHFETVAMMRLRSENLAFESQQGAGQK